MRAFICFILLIFISSVSAKETSVFSKEQLKILDKAEQIGKPFGLGHTLKALIWQESFFGKSIRRENPELTTFGITKMKPSTVADFFPVDHEIIKQKLLTDDTFAIKMALQYLLTLKLQTKSNKEMLQAYNAGLGGIPKGRGLKYAHNVSMKATQFMLEAI